MRAAGGFPDRQNKANWPAGLGAWPAGSAEFEVSSVKPGRSGIQPSDFKLHTSNCILLEKRLTTSLRRDSVQNKANWHRDASALTAV
jgi:hypothetical protein